MIGRVLGFGSAARDVGEAVGSVAEVFVGNRAERDTADLERYSGALAQFGEEFGKAGTGHFDGFVNGLNRLPRPMMAVGTIGLFTYAMLDPNGFATRMQGLAYIPEPLWWLLGAVVSFYFGARELHHYRGRKFDLPAPPPQGRTSRGYLQQATIAPTRPASPSAEATEPHGSQPQAAGLESGRVSALPSAGADFNAAFEEWRAGRA